MKIVKFGKRLFETELVIFDKDGTLTDFRKTWIPILKKRLELIFDHLGINEKREKIKEEVYGAFGIGENLIDPYGPFPYSTPWEDEIIFSIFLYKNGIPWQKARDTSRYAIDKAERELDRTRFTQLYPGVKEVLENLRQSGVLISLATADLTSIALDTLKHLRIYDLFDYIIGADMVKEGKPNPEMIFKTVDALHVDIKKTAMVGDTITDMEMGKKAGAGLVVGILEGGVANFEHLSRDADLVLESVREIQTLS